MDRVVLLLAAISTYLSSAVASPAVKVSLRSPWSAPPILTEILETVTLENPDGFFTFLDQLTDPNVLALTESLTPEATRQAALQVALDNNLLRHPDSLSAVDMNLALHSATPKIEAFYNYYEDHHNNSKGTQCGSWVDWYGDVVCDIETLARVAGIETIDSAAKSSSYPRPNILTFDHIYPPLNYILERPPRTAILYGLLNSPNFRELHTYLHKLSDRSDPHVEYIFRHIPPANRNSVPNYLSGYGVALDLKKMDYLALDDRFSRSGDEKDGLQNNSEELPSVDPVISLIQSHPDNETAPDANVALTQEELAALGPQVVQLLAESSEPLDTLIRLSQDFPKYATTLARRVIANESIKAEVHDNSLKAKGGINMFWLNGAVLEVKDTEPLALLRHIKKEGNLVSSLTSLGLSNRQAFELLTHTDISGSQRDTAVLDGLFDASDRLEGGDLILYWNDLAKDSRYARWSPSLYSLLRPTYPGQLPAVRANLFNVVMVLDLSQIPSLSFIAGPMTNMLERSIPFRFGVVPVVETEEGIKMARLFYYLVQNFGRRKTLNLIKQISQMGFPQHEHSPTVQWSSVRDAYNQLIEAETLEDPDKVKATFDSVIDGETSPPGLSEKLTAYAKRLDASLANYPAGHVFFNGKHYDMDNNFLRLLQVDVMQHLQYVQEKVYEGVLNDENEQDLGTYFYDLPSTSKRRNRYIFPGNGAGNLRIVNLPEVFSKTKFKLSDDSYLYPASADSIPLSVYAVADFDSEGGLGLIAEALKSLKPESRSRITFVHNPSQPENIELGSASLLIAQLLLKGQMSKASPATLLQALGVASTPASDDTDQIPLSKDEAILSLTRGVALTEINATMCADYMKQGRLLARQLQIQSGQSVLVVNGRIVGPIKPGDFQAADFEALEDYEIRQRSEPVFQAAKDVAPAIAEDQIKFSDLVSMSSSIIASIQLPDPSESGLFDAPQRPRQRTYQLLDSTYTAFEFGDNATARYHIAVLVDPLSEIGQKWSSTLKWLSNIPDVFIEVHLNPAHYSDLPLKRFYRSNLSPSLSFDESGQELPSEALFEDLPIDPIYTLAMDVPSSWLVRPREALYDLDNIQLSQLFSEDQSLNAVFALDFLIIGGHARETNTNAPPRGVQLQLVNSDQVPIQDTQVVANLGYFQFKAKPGVFELEIRAGRGRKIYKMDSVGGQGFDSPTVDESGNLIALTSFEGLTLYPRLERRQGMELVDVLQEEAILSGSGGILDDIISRIMSIFKTKKPEGTGLTPVKKQADINIFTVASGLLYERFASIMILSVLRNTNSTVKFWFIENFLSPSFLEFIPHMASQYNFQYELVTYKWPSWLRAQTEKQRIIWAYKILFLDVLFPMDLKKVIFVDADQIVRADLKELVDLDLHGAPYGYTPMGDDNEDMEGFRFWKTGYWNDFLQGKPYHISALYVIDLVKFRQMAAGDILRQQYQALSADPNSLSNLDQDLPNNLQKEVPIFSLDEDWLWCETWCSKDRLHRAKTIDLCQNPLTKEPKLVRARQIPEWEEYDAEIAKFTRKLAEEGKIHSRLATADANVLAGAGAGASSAAKAGVEEGIKEGLELNIEEGGESRPDAKKEPDLRDEL